MRSRPATIPQYLKSGRLAMFFLIFYVLFVPVVFLVEEIYVLKAMSTLSQQLRTRN
jgi:hypothetical protein